MVNLESLLGIITFILYSIIMLWFVSMYVIQTGKIKLFVPFFIIGFLFAYFGAFVFFRMYYFIGWGILKILEVAAFILLLRELLLHSKYE